MPRRSARVSSQRGARQHTVVRLPCCAAAARKKTPSAVLQVPREVWLFRRDSFVFLRFQHITPKLEIHGGGQIPHSRAPCSHIHPVRSRWAFTTYCTVLYRTVQYTRSLCYAPAASYLATARCKNSQAPRYGYVPYLPTLGVLAACELFSTPATRLPCATNRENEANERKDDPESISQDFSTFFECRFRTVVFAQPSTI